ncbi:hypothetical protein Tco_0958017 [Tanacetum coccineum]
MYANNPFSPPHNQQQQNKCINRLTNNNLKCIVHRCNHHHISLNLLNLFYTVNRFGVDDKFESLFVYAPGGQGSSGISVPVQDDSLIEEVAPVKRKYTKRRQQSKKTENQSNEPWNPEEETTLCKAWINTTENYIGGNAKKSSEFWIEVLGYFEKEMGESKRGYDSLRAPQQMENGRNAKVLQQIQRICFTRTMENTSHATSNSTQAGFNLNDEATDSDDVEVRPICRDKAKKKVSSSSVRSKSSVVSGALALIDQLVDK